VGALSQARRLRDGTAMAHRFRIGSVAACVALLLVSPVAAGDSYPVPGFFAGGLTAQSSWAQILKKYPEIQADFPMLNFGKTFVPLSAVCVAGETLRVADPRSDNGVRISSTLAPGWVHARRGASGHATARVGRFDVAPLDQGLEEQPPPGRIRYPVSVYKMIPRLSSTERVFLFEKPWELPTCSPP
jgi:hypothetical protein